MHSFQWILLFHVRGLQNNFGIGREMHRMFMPHSDTLNNAVYGMKRNDKYL